MKNYEFPYTGWVLHPSFKPVEVTFVDEFNGWTGSNTYHVAQSGKYVEVSEIHRTKIDAICDGYGRIKKQQADIDKKQENINKRISTLDKFAKS